MHRRRSTLIAAVPVAAMLFASTGARRPRLLPIKQLTAEAGLTGGGTGPTVSLGLAPGGVTSAHVQDGALTVNDFALSAREALKGEVGAQGPQGAPGVQGEPGPAGQGPAGAMGLKGDAGAEGPVGPQGPRGFPGETGPQGPQGLQGLMGLQGPMGPMGLQGLKGDTGATGAKGGTGAQGPKGDTGDTGPQGPAGESAITDGPGSGGTTTEFARRGTPAPGGGLFYGGGIGGDLLPRSVGNRRGELLFATGVDVNSDGAWVNGVDTVGLFLAGPNGMVRIAHTGMEMPGGGVFEVFPGLEEGQGLNAVRQGVSLLLTDTGGVYFVVYTTDGVASERCLFGWKDGQLFPIKGRSATTVDGLPIGDVADVQILSPNRVGYRARVASSALGQGFTSYIGSFVYETPAP